MAIINNHQLVQQPLSQQTSCSVTTTTFTREVFDDVVVPSPLRSVAPIMRVAAEIQKNRPRVAYLCQLYAFKKAHRLDPDSTGRGVQHFMNNLHQRLERDNASTLPFRVKKTDAQEIKSFYEQYYEHYIVIINKGVQDDRAAIGKAYQTAGVLFEVLCSINETTKIEEVPPEKSDDERIKMMSCIPKKSSIHKSLLTRDKTCDLSWVIIANKDIEEDGKYIDPKTSCGSCILSNKFVKTQLEVVSKRINEKKMEIKELVILRDGLIGSLPT